MKNTTRRFILGVVSSALFAVGLVRAGDHFDPVKRSLPLVDATVHEMAGATGTECNSDDPPTNPPDNPNQDQNPDPDNDPNPEPTPENP